jgi:hypothetical protein
LLPLFFQEPSVNLEEEWPYSEEHGKPTITFSKLVDKLQRHYVPAPPPSTDPLELIIWENIAYLANDKRRAEAFAILKRTIGTCPDQILAVYRDFFKPRSQFVLSGNPIALAGGLSKVLAVHNLHCANGCTRLTSFSARYQAPD